MDVADPIPPSVQALMDLFANDLADVSFPGVDRATLEQVVKDVRANSKAVADAEATLEAARTALRESEEMLVNKTQRALAYARVFAADRPELSARVESVARIAGVPSSPPTSARSADASGGDAPKRRGRPPKNKAAAEPAEGSTPAPPAVEAAPASPGPLVTPPPDAEAEAPVNGVAHATETEAQAEA
jgi:hypothetical protein